LKFGGGCQGCGQVDLTLKEGVEKTLLQQIPELTAVRDVTDHSNQENAYYKKA
jgi:Fe/S biogenesis protein NfuA